MRRGRTARDLDPQGQELSPILVLLLVWLAFCVSAAAAAHSEPALDPDAAMAESQAAIGRKPGDYAFRVAGGRQVRLADYRGKPLVVSFVYTGCTAACPATTRQLAQSARAAQAIVGADAFGILSIGFNLPYDSPEAMREHAKRFGLALPSWQFATPYEAQLGDLTRDFGFSFVPTSWGFDHVAQITILDATGRIYRQVYGDFEVRRLVDPLKELIEGTPLPVTSFSDLVDRVRLLCTIYDPRTNTYRFKTVIIGEIASFAAITLAVAWFVWRERRRGRNGRRSPSARASPPHEQRDTNGFPP
jgi:protein SCO1/2